VALNVNGVSENYTDDDPSEDTLSIPRIHLKKKGKKKERKQLLPFDVTPTRLSNFIFWYFSSKRCDRHMHCTHRALETSRFFSVISFLLFFFLF